MNEEKKEAMFFILKQLQKLQTAYFGRVDIKIDVDFTSGYCMHIFACASNMQVKEDKGVLIKCVSIWANSNATDMILPLARFEDEVKAIAKKADKLTTGEG